MYKHLLIAGTALILAAGTPALAKGHSDSHMSDQGRANNNGPNATDRQFGRDRAEQRHNLRDSSDTTVDTKLKGGKSKSHMSANGLINTNGPNAVDRQFGINRAALRHKQHDLKKNRAAKDKRVEADEAATTADLNRHNLSGHVM